MWLSLPPIKYRYSPGKIQAGSMLLPPELYSPMGLCHHPTPDKKTRDLQRAEHGDENWDLILLQHQLFLKLLWGWIHIPYLILIK